MIGKIIAGSSFAGTVGYVIKKQSRVLAAEGIAPPNVRDMIQDFKDQTLLNPRIKNAVGHISLSFSSKDAPRMTDALMLDIAKENAGILLVNEDHLMKNFSISLRD